MAEDYFVPVDEDFDGALPPLLLPSAPGVKVPHVGWNNLAIRRESTLLAGVPDGAQVYFTHSYAAPVTDTTVATADHGVPFAAVVEHGHVFGVQFHPEKSGDAGLRILRSFVQIAMPAEAGTARTTC